MMSCRDGLSELEFNKALQVIRVFISASPPKPLPESYDSHALNCQI